VGGRGLYQNLKKLYLFIRASWLTFISWIREKDIKRVSLTQFSAWARNKSQIVRGKRLLKGWDKPMTDKVPLSKRTGDKETPPTRIQYINHIFSERISFFSKTLLAIFFIILSLYSIRILRDDRLVITSFTVPKEATENGLTGEVLVKEILDRIEEISLEAQKNAPKEIKEILEEEDTRIPDLEVATLSFESIIESIGAALNINQNKISGELIFKSDYSTKLTLRIPGEPIILYEESQTKSAESEVAANTQYQHVNDMVNKAAVEILETLDPITLANYYYTVSVNSQELAESFGDDRFLASIGYKSSNNFLDECETLLVSVIHDSKVSSDELAWAYFSLGNVAWQKKDYKQALIQYQKAVDEVSNLGSGWLKLGDSYLNLGNYTKAKECYEKAKRHLTDPLDAYIGLAYCEMELGNWDNAFDEVENISNEVERSAGTIQNLQAQIYYNQGQLSDAINYMRKAIEEDGDDPSFYKTLGTYLIDGALQSSDLQETKDYLNEASSYLNRGLNEIRQAGGDQRELQIDILGELACLWLMRGDTLEASQNVKKLFTVYNYDLAERRELYIESQDNKKKAENEFNVYYAPEKAEHTNKPALIHLYFANLWFDRGQYGKVSYWLARTTEDGLEYIHKGVIRRFKGEYYSTTSNWEQTDTSFLEAAEVFDDAKTYWPSELIDCIEGQQIAKLYQNNYQAAIKHGYALMTLIDENENFTAYQKFDRKSKLGYLLVRYGDDEQRESGYDLLDVASTGLLTEELKTSSRLDWRAGYYELGIYQARVLRILARLALGDGKVYQAIDHLEEASRLDITNPFILLDLVTAYEKAGYKEDKIEELYQQALGCSGITNWNIIANELIYFDPLSIQISRYKKLIEVSKGFPNLYGVLLKLLAVKGDRVMLAEVAEDAESDGYLPYQEINFYPFTHFSKEIEETWGIME